MSTLTDTIGISAERAVRIENLRKTYRDGKQRRVALDELALEVKPGEWLALLGPSGCGKSTLLRLCAALESPDFGLVEIAGNNSSTHPDMIRSRVGVVFGTPALDGLLSVGDNLLLQGSLFHLPKSGSVMRAKALTDQFGLTGHLKDRVDTLSPSMMLRVDLARALMSEPALLLLDEPTSGLDQAARMQFLDLIASLREQRPEMAIVMSTNLIDEAERADTLALMTRGAIVTSGPPEALRDKLAAQVITTTSEHAKALRQAGLDTREAGAQAFGVGRASNIKAACDELLEHGAIFSIGSATMSDIFQAHSNEDTVAPAMTDTHVEEAA